LVFPRLPFGFGLRLRFRAPGFVPTGLRTLCLHSPVGNKTHNMGISRGYLACVLWTNYSAGGGRAASIDSSTMARRSKVANMSRS
jgi:hypothetical protein